MRSTNGSIHRRRRQRLLKKAKGFRGSGHRLYRTAKSAVMKAGQHAYNSRRQFKRDMRSLWIMRINAAVRKQGMSYSVFMYKAGKSGLALNRFALAKLAVEEPDSFAALVKSLDA